MIVRLALAVVVAVTGMGLPAAAVTSTTATQPAPLAPAPAPQGVPAPGAAEAATGPDETTVTELAVVVPAVAADGSLGALTAPAPTGDPGVVAGALVADRLMTEVVETGEFQTLGVTWPGGATVDGLDIQVRARAAQGEWTAWAPLQGADEAPDPGTVDAISSRGGTDSLWVGDAEAVQLSFAAGAAGGPQDLRLVLVDVPEITHAGLDAVVEQTATEPGTGAEGDEGTDVQQTGTTVAASGVAPRVITRAEWGARPQVCTPDVASRGLVGAAVHHTAGPNTYATVAEAMRQIRGDQAYHIDARKWCDIGYNFIVDKWGNIYEGRADSLTSPVIGVHAGGFNTGTVGVSMLGTYDAVPPPAVQQAVGQIIGFRLAGYGVDPTTTMTYYTGAGDNSRFKNQNVSLNRIFGHREVSYTACPGAGGMAVLGTVRQVAKTYYDAAVFSQNQAVVKALYKDLLGRGPDPTGLAGWTAALMTGTPQDVLVETLTRSDEYISKRITKAYTEVLGRGPDPVGAQEWLVAIRNREATVDDVQRRFYDSQEYFIKSGNTTEGYVQRLFTTMLRRPATAAEVTDWSTKMTTQGRAWVVDAIWFSTEAARVRAGDYYQTFLGRGPDPTGLAAWAGVLLSHGEGAVRNGIAGSNEYRLLAIKRYP